MAGKSNTQKSKSKNTGSAKPPLQDGAQHTNLSTAARLQNGRSQSKALSSEIDDLKLATGESELGNGVKDEKLKTNCDNLVPGETAMDSLRDQSETLLQGQEELRLYPMIVKGPSGEQIELQVNPGDSIMDLRQFLLDAPETCFYTCYDLVLKAPDGLKYHLAEYLEIGEVADVTVGGCSLEMVTALYDDRSVRAHVRRTRDLISASNTYSSLSTSLAIEHEAKQSLAGNNEEKEAASTGVRLKSSAGKEGGYNKPEAAELEGLGFMEDPMPNLADLALAPVEQEVKCVGSIAFSSFNPVPGYRRLHGDLLYLDIVTVEGERFCVSAHTQGFYVNLSKEDTLDPYPTMPVVESTTLVGILRQISPMFVKGHPFENVPVLLPPNSWLGPYPLPSHKRDIGRAEDSLIAPYGTEVIGMQRDWNEELQSCREFPRGTLQDRIMRDRALYKVNCDFVDAATKGAKAVIGRCIPPINPTDPERFHMYVHNNIFFSFAVDGDLTLIRQAQNQETQLTTSEAPRKTEVNDSTSGIEETVSPSSDHITSSIDSSGATSKEDAITASALPSTLEVAQEDELSQAIDSEQATYASANNDLKGTKAYNNADVSGLYTLAMAIVDYRGHRVVAQSIIPGILQGDKTESLLYGSVDNGKKISWNEKFHLKVLEAGKLIHIKEHEILDGSGNKVKMCAPVECKGIVGSDDRYYMLDLMRTTPRDINYMGPGSRLCVLRPELVSAFCQVEALERLKKTKGEEETYEKSLSQEHLPMILLNPNVFTDFTVAGEPEEKLSDEELVRKAGQYLVEVVLPKFIQDLRSLEVSPMDGQTLSEALHAHGINIRYLGQVALLAKDLPHIWDLCIIEMAVRSAKHVLKGILRETPDQDVAGAIAHFFNCLLGLEVVTASSETVPQILSGPEKSEVSGKPPRKASGKKKKGGSHMALPEKANLLSSSYTEEVKQIDSTKDRFKQKRVPYVDKISEKRPSYTTISSELVWSDIIENVKLKYQFDLPEDARSRVRKISTFRNLCQKVGVTLAARSYDFNAPAAFQTLDIQDLHAVVKHAAPACADSHDLMESGKLRLAQGKLSEAYELFSEAFTILQQVCGPMHREVANCCRYLAMVLYHAGDMAGAIMQQHKELIINERCLGIDHPDTAHSYGNMALFYHGLNQTELALRHMGRALLLLNVSCGSDHPDVAATFINIAVMYQEMDRMHVALRYLQEALKKNERLLGSDHLQTAVCYHALAIAFNCMGAYKLSLQHERSTYNILVKQLGEKDSRTNDSAMWIKTFLKAHAEKQIGQQAVNVATAQKAAEVLKARSDLVQVFQAAAGGTAGRGVISKAAAAAALMGDVVPRSRGIDERGARAAAEVRKKAAAKGLHVRPQAPGKSVPPLNDLLTLINTGLVNATPSNGSAASNSEIAAKGISSQVEPDLKHSEPKTVSANGAAELDSQQPDSIILTETAGSRTPLGLGGGLNLPDNKKRRPKKIV
ncbi:hypothetical protein O6H91_09G113600 [Diphasiastrum complanatum]|uniref:Uncharacterized protein n=1 Tax=Diphasiastrum complanatum TaxID=34168 RepID=A0ACC2CTE2_DIPCM|nr:hypothetical protein O6H91_09G113600 [Diphasiastrum complanatum]